MSVQSSEVKSPESCPKDANKIRDCQAGKNKYVLKLSNFIDEKKKNIVI